MTKYLDALRAQRELIAARLRGLPVEKQAAFAAAAAEEVLPVYIAYAESRDSENVRVMREAVAAVWETAVSGTTESFPAAELRERCLDATPHTDDAESLLDEAGSDAGLVVVAAVRAAGGDGEGGSDAAAGMVSLLDNVLDADDESAEIPGPIELELARQRAALDRLESGDVDPDALRRLGRAQVLLEEVNAASRQRGG